MRMKDTLFLNKNKRGQLGWAFVLDPRKEPGMTGWCPGSSGVLMAFSLTTQLCL